jgi:MFS family permease
MSKKRLFAGISLNIVLLAFASFLTDVSSEMILPILPLFITTLGGGGLAVGLIGGLSDSLASILKVFSGYWSDLTRKRKPFVFWGYFSSAVAKLFFPLAQSWPVLLILRPIERIGKGLREAPRDALLADSSLPEIRGKIFGLHRTADTLGAFLGASLALIFYWLLKLEFRGILLIAGVTAFSALVPLFFVKEKKSGSPSSNNFLSSSLRLNITALEPQFKHYLFVVTIFALGNFTYMFFILRAKKYFLHLFPEHLANIFPILLYIWFNIFYTLFSLPGGILSDKIGRKKVIILGYIIFFFTCLGFSFANSTVLFIFLFAFYGIAYAFIEANQRAYAVDFVSAEKRGLALGTLHTMLSLATLPGGIIAGLLWNLHFSLPFLYAAILTLISVLIFLRL